MAKNTNFWKNKNVFVTGHTGFKGSWLSIWLEYMGANVTGYSLKPKSSSCLFYKSDIGNRITSIYGDILNYKKLFKSIDHAKPEIFFHLAAQPLVSIGYKNPLKTFNTNIIGTVNVLEILKQSESIKSIIVVTSDKVYKNTNNFKGYNENNTIGGFDPYSSSKSCCELISETYRKSFFVKKNIGLATARAGNVIGGGDYSKDRLIPDIIKSIRKKKNLQIRDKNNIRPWQFVLEALCGYLVLAQSLHKNIGLSDSWNFGPKSTDCKKVEWIVKKFRKKFDFQFSYLAENSMHETKLLKLDISKSKRKLNWQPIISINKAVNYTSEWYEKKLKGSNEYEISLEQIKSYKKIHGEFYGKS